MFGKKDAKFTADFQRVTEKMKAFTLTSGYTFDGRPIQAYCGPICADALIGAIIGTGILPSNGVQPFSDSFGKQSDAMEAGRFAALEQLLQKAEALGANALIGITYQYVVVDKNGVFVTMSATAVKI